MSFAILFEGDLGPAEMDGNWRPRPLDMPSKEYWKTKLTCQGCLLPLTPPVFYCQNVGGIHPLCNYCSNCSCHFRKGPSRCSVLEKILVVTKFKCEFGCKNEAFPASEYRVHVKRCHVRPMACILCGDKIPFRLYFLHLKDYHRISERKRDTYGNFYFDGFEFQPRIEYYEPDSVTVIFFRYESSKFWLEVLSEEEEVEIDFYSMFDVQSHLKKMDGRLKFLNARSSHEGTAPTNPEAVNPLRRSIRSVSDVGGELKTCIIPPTHSEMFLTISREDDISITSMTSFDSEWDENPPEQSDRMQHYVRRLVDEVTDLVDKKRMSLPAGASLRSVEAYNRVMSIPEDDEELLLRTLESTASSGTLIDDLYRDLNGDEVDAAVVAKNEDKRRHILEEIITTERGYVNDMEEILTGYGEESTSLDGYLFKILPPQLVKYSQTSSSPTGDLGFEPALCFKHILFGNLEEIHIFQATKFLPRLEEAIRSGSVDNVGYCFLQAHTDFLHLYSRYCQMLPSVTAVRKEIGDKHPWLEMCREKLNHRLALDAYLMKPVQRITKYQLLLKDLMKYSEDCPGYAILLEAVSKMLEVLRSVDESMLQLTIVDCPYKLEDEGLMRLQSAFLLWTEGEKYGRSSGHSRHIFLYDRSILMCKPEKTGRNDSALHFKLKISLSDIGLTESPKGVDDTFLPLTFELWLPGRTKRFLFQAPSPEIKDVWVKAIQSVLMEQFKSRKYSSLSKSNSFSSVSSNMSIG